MLLVNITNPDQPPVTGDWVEYHYDNGAVEGKTYHEPVAPPAPTERYITGLEYLRRFTQAQRIAIRDLAKTDPIAEDLVHLLDATISQGGKINLMDADTVGGVGYLATMLPAQSIVPAVILA